MNLGNWKTSALGIVVLLVGAALLYTGKITWDQFIVFIGLGGLGLLSKDHDATGGKRNVR
jgi:hypothetical protein